MIAIVNYGLGNVRAIANIYKRLGIDARIACSADELLGADRVILPGVGAFDWAMRRLAESGMRPLLDEMVVQQGKPVLGICVGMQIMARGSDEGGLEGLGWIDADVLRLDRLVSAEKAQLPHMGWNDVRPVHDDGLFRNLGALGRFYFLHSYYVAPASEANVAAVTSYGSEFASGVVRANVHGVQFHPEKSHAWGIRLLQNFAEI